MIDVVEPPPGLEVEVRHHHRIRSELADLPRNGPPQLMGGFDQAIGEVEDLEIVDADDIAGPALLGCSALGDYIRGPVPDAGLTPGEQKVGDFLALVGPFGDGRRTPVFHVIGVGDYAEDTIDIAIVEEREFSHDTRLCARPRFRQGWEAQAVWVP